MSVSASASPAKFAFDLDLGKARTRNRVIGEQALADLLSAAEQKGYQKGVEQGQSNTTSRAAQELSAAATSLAARTAGIAEASDRAQKQILADATRLGVAVGRKLAANLIARFPLSEIEILLGECLSSLENAPHLVIRCHPDLAGALRETSEAQIATSGYSGRLVVLGEPDISLGDARLEWVDGGLVRDTDALSRRIEERINAFIASNEVPATTKTPNPETAQ